MSLGTARFACALLLPPMRADPDWSYFTAGSMNTVNAAGYLAGALLLPRLLVRVDARRVILAGGAVAALLLPLHGATRHDAVLYGLLAGSGEGPAGRVVEPGVDGDVDAVLVPVAVPGFVHQQNILLDPGVP
ncbi:MAG: YbfB/YjiJ family MFS transporter, partial [Rubrivivax sp.]|nr:YbfB/YjiJ family MFS transporter [Rubrivivax sp.]